MNRKITMLTWKWGWGSWLASGGHIRQSDRILALFLSNTKKVFHSWGGNMYPNLVFSVCRNNNRCPKRCVSLAYHRNLVKQIWWNIWCFRGKEFTYPVGNFYEGKREKRTEYQSLCWWLRVIGISSFSNTLASKISKFPAFLLTFFDLWTKLPLRFSHLIIT